jgi:hypothetical protein
MGHRPVDCVRKVALLDTGCAPTEAFDDTAGLREDVCSRWTAAVEAAALHPGRIAGAIKAIAAAGGARRVRADAKKMDLLRRWSSGLRSWPGHYVDAAHC